MGRGTARDSGAANLRDRLKPDPMTTPDPGNEILTIRIIAQRPIRGHLPAVRFHLTDGLLGPASPMCCTGVNVFHPLIGPTQTSRTRRDRW